MHGRVKTRTSAEQKEIKRQEREKKVKDYKLAMKILQDKRSTSTYDQEALGIISNMLLANPDIITLWNYRREIFLHMKKEQESESFDKLLEKDLGFTEQCLRVNPKSYGSWHHRVWVLDNLSAPNWEKELNICTRYLELDERNFHCWNYRKVITQKSNVPDLDEYNYTYQKIKDNFSNYSAWHLRSKLLPKIFPDNENKLPISEDKHKEELIHVRNAAFTDPNDQSAWFYQRWLLGITEPEIHFAAIQTTKNEVFIALSKSIRQNDSLKAGVTINIGFGEKVISGSWESSNGHFQSPVWIFHFDHEISDNDVIALQLLKNGVEIDSANMKPSRCLIRKPNFTPKFSENLIKALTEELSSFQELLEIEPDSKWTLLTSLLLKWSINMISYENEIIEDLQKLINVDPLRRGYYEDLSSKIKIEIAIINCFNDNNLNDSEFSIDDRHLSFSLTDSNLMCLYHMQYLLLFECVDFSSNNVKSDALVNLHCLRNCSKLNLSSNRITDLSYMPALPNLTSFLFMNNSIETFDREHLKRFLKLKVVAADNNPAVNNQSEIEKLNENFKTIFLIR